MNAQIAEQGLSSIEAGKRLTQYGPNAIEDVSDRPLRRLAEKFWAPVPWLLEATVLLELILGKTIEAAVIFALLLFNAAIGFFQESRAQATLTALKSRLSLTAAYNNRERRHLWASLPSRWVLIASCTDIAVTAVLAVAGVAMHALPALLVLETFVAATVFAVAFDFLKVPAFRRLQIA